MHSLLLITRTSNATNRHKSKQLILAVVSMAEEEVQQCHSYPALLWLLEGSGRGQHRACSACSLPSGYSLLHAMLEALS